VDLTSTRANDRFRDEFRDLLTDADIEGSHAPKPPATTGSKRRPKIWRQTRTYKWCAVAPGERPEGARTDGTEPAAADGGRGEAGGRGVRCGAVPGGTQRGSRRGGRRRRKHWKERTGERLKRAASVRPPRRLGLWRYSSAICQQPFINERQRGAKRSGSRRQRLFISDRLKSRRRPCRVLRSQRPTDRSKATLDRLLKTALSRRPSCRRGRRPAAAHLLHHPLHVAFAHPLELADRLFHHGVLL